MSAEVLCWLDVHGGHNPWWCVLKPHGCFENKQTKKRKKERNISSALL